MSGIQTQAFRALLSSRVVSIPTRHDAKSRQRVVRWKDVLLCFESAKYAMNGDDIALFLTDDNLDE